EQGASGTWGKRRWQPVERMRPRIAFVGVVALALCVTAGLSAGAGDAKKKKKNKNPGRAGDITMPVNTQSPDAAGTGANFKTGLVSSTITVPAAKPFIGTVVRDVNVTLQTTGNAANAAGDLAARVTAPNGATAWLLNFTLSGQSVGPLTFDD